MKTRYMLGAAIVVALNCATANAQILGGNIAGGLGGTLGGGIGGVRDIGVMGQGGGQGSFGADLDTSTLRRTTGDVATRARGAASAASDRAASAVGRARETGANVGATSQEHAVRATSAVRDSTASSVSGAFEATQQAATTSAFQSATTAAASSVQLDRNVAQGAIGATQTQQLTAMNDHARVDQVAAGALVGQVVSQAGEVKPAADLSPAQAAPTEPSASGAALGGALNKSVDTQTSTDDERLPLTATAEGSADSEASASERGARANGSASGSASVAKGS